MVTDQRDDRFDLRWEPSEGKADFYRVEYTISVSPSPGAHMNIDLPLPDGPSKLTIIVEKEGATQSW